MKDGNSCALMLAMVRSSELAQKNEFEAVMEMFCFKEGSIGEEIFVGRLRCVNLQLGPAIYINASLVVGDRNPSGLEICDMAIESGSIFLRVTVLDPCNATEVQLSIRSRTARSLIAPMAFLSCSNQSVLAIEMRTNHLRRQGPHVEPCSLSSPSAGPSPNPSQVPFNFSTSLSKSATSLSKSST